MANETWEEGKWIRTPLEGFNTTVQDTVNNESWRISEALQEVGNQITHLWELIVSKKDDILLDYTILKSDDDTIIRKKIRRLITTDPQLKVIFGKLSEWIQDNDDSELLDLVVDACIKKLDFESKKRLDLPNWWLVSRFKSGKESLISELQKAKNINIGWNGAPQIYWLEVDELDFLFSNLENVVWIDFTWADLEKLSKGKLTAIFSHLHNVQVIDFTETNINLLDEESLEIIFKNVSDARHIAFISNKITDEVLQALVNYSKNAKFIDFDFCWLTDEQKQFITWKFPNTNFSFEEMY